LQIGIFSAENTGDGFVVCAGAKEVTVCNDTIGIWDKKNR